MAVLTVLADGAKHPARINQDLAGHARDARLHPRKLNELLGHLVTRGLIEHDRWELFEGWLLQYYRITATGTDALAADAAGRSAGACAVRQLGRLVTRACW